MLTREHGGWEQAIGLIPSDERSRNKALDEVSAAIPGDASRRERRFSAGARFLRSAAKALLDEAAKRQATQPR